jgi:hypothetical protein
MTAPLQIDHATSTEWQTCWRCTQLGIRTPTIAPGQPHFVFTTDGCNANCCADCWARLAEEL